MKLTIRQLKLTNFKGIKSLTIPFDQVTNISGENATGKTTIFDAFTWLLFGKNATDAKDFGVKPVGSEKIDVEVEGIFSIGTQDIILKRILREKWVKQRGEPEPKFTGNETLFFWNDVPQQAGEFALKVKELIDESLFKMLTSPLYFNSLHWEKRRAILTDLAGDVTDESITGLNPAFAGLIDMLSGKSFIDFKKELASKRKKLNDELDLIPARIDEVKKGTPEAKDYSGIRKEIEKLTTEKATIEAQILDKSKAVKAAGEERAKLQQQLNTLKSKYTEAFYQAKNNIQKSGNEQGLKISQVESKIKLLNAEIEQENEIIRSLSKNNEVKNNTITGLRDNWTAENARIFVMDAESYKCPTCLREFDPADIEAKQAEMETNFNEAKTKTLNAIHLQGTQLRDQIAANEIKIAEAKQKVRDLEFEVTIKTKELETLKANQVEVKEYTQADFATTPDAELLNQQIRGLDAKLSEPLPTIDTFDLTNQLADIQNLIDDHRATLTNEQRIMECNTRLSELEVQEKDYAQQIADLEKQEFLMQLFTKAKMEKIESLVNSKFKHAKFQLFENQINGSEVPCCITLVNGVPFSDANSAGKINTGLDIINTLSDHYQVSAPIFIDNRESTNEIIPVNSQLINLWVTKDKKLKFDAVPAKMQAELAL